jgi:MoxR-like ATPase
MLKELVDQIASVIVGKREQIELSVICLLANGHLLIEDVPGVGKTTLAHALARSIGLSFSRVQFTSDLLPSDVLGVSVYERVQEKFIFHPGPVFAQVLLADEINRAGPRTQSALLEAMEERQVSVDGETRALPCPFFVLATQNPSDQLGTHPLPESQLDRFALCIALGYPDAQAERLLLKGIDRRVQMASLQPVLTPAQWLQLQQRVDTVHVADDLLDYLQALVAATRNGQWCVHGLSPRAVLSLLRLCRARALLQDRGHVSPTDVQALWASAVNHRLIARPIAGQQTGRHVGSLASSILAAVPVP